MCRHALVEVGRGQGHDDCTHAGQVADAKLKSTTERACCRPDMTTLDQRLDNGQLAVRGTFLYGKL
jgi:outer membrane lipoprotein SlyB